MGRPEINIAGRRFGILTAIKRVANDKSGNTMWQCRCDCGSVIELQRSNLVGRQVSCGCLGRRLQAEKMRTHGLSKHPLYNIWNMMLQRCYNKRIKCYARYGGRGITVCKRWRDSVEAFIEDMSPRPSPAHSIERIDNDKGYSKENCRWATVLEQSHNKRVSYPITIKGETMTMAEWSRHYNTDNRLVHARIHRGWAPEEALSTPPKKGNYRTKRESSP